MFNNIFIALDLKSKYTEDLREKSQLSTTQTSDQKQDRKLPQCFQQTE